MSPPIVTDFKVKKTFFGTYQVIFACPHCNSELRCNESEIDANDWCPDCRESFRISSKASAEIEAIQKQTSSEMKRKSAQNQEQAEKAKNTLPPSSDKTRKIKPLNEQPHIRTKQQIRSKASKVILTTTMHVEGHVVSDYLGIESVEYVIGTGVFSEFTSGVADIFGQRSSAFEQKLQTAKRAVFEALSIRAVEYGANAVIGVDLDFTEFSGNRVALIVSGTLVRISPRED